MRGIYVIILFIVTYNLCGQCAQMAYRGNNGSKDCIELVWSSPPSNLNFSVTVAGQPGIFNYRSGNGTMSSRAQYLRTGANCNGVTPGNLFQGELVINGESCQYQSGVLPVEFGHISIQKKHNGNIEINWISLQEINNQYFTIYRSADQQEFSEIGYVESKGQEHGRTAYQFIDDNPKEEILFYKIGQTDYDGKISYTKIYKFDNRTHYQSPKYIYNRKQKFIEIIATGATNKLSVIALDGNLLHSQYIQDNVKIDLQNYPAGMYVISFSGKQTETYKIVIP